MKHGHRVRGSNIVLAPYEGQDPCSWSVPENIDTSSCFRTNLESQVAQQSRSLFSKVAFT